MVSASRVVENLETDPRTASRGQYREYTCTRRRQTNLHSSWLNNTRALKNLRPLIYNLAHTAKKKTPSREDAATQTDSNSWLQATAFRLELE